MTGQTDSPVDRILAFGPYRLLLEKRVLLQGDKPLHLGSRALEILTALAERSGELVTKEELVARVWPNTFVEEGNLRVHIAALRRALGNGEGGDQYISTVPGRGYRFVGLAIVKDRPEPVQQIAKERTENNLPSPLARMVGRAEIVATIVEQMPQRRFITIAGPGGIGKTTVALAVADKLAPGYRDGVRFIDLAPIADAQALISTLVSLVGVPSRSGILSSGLASYLRDKQILLLFDNCDHVIETIASTAEEIYRHAPQVHILATSREPLRVEGERVQRLLPLGLPNTTANITAKEALIFPAIQLFVERLAAISDEFELDDSNAPQVADICRRLDGIALAIELAVGSVDMLGINGLAAGLDDRFRVLTRGRRTALPRHQTLRAVLDWSYEFLPEAERVVLRRLAIFAGPFILNAAQAVAAGPNVDAGSFADIIANLFAKSLLSVDVGDMHVRYRLLDTTRAYGLDKLREAGELEASARRHAEYYRELFERAKNEWDTRSTAELLADYAPRIDNVRAALDWAFSPGGDSRLGISLTIAAVPLWRVLSLMGECRSRVRRALAGPHAEARHNARDSMKLLSALGAALRYDKDPTHEIESAWTEALAIAEEAADVDYQLRAISGLRNVRLSEENLRAALNLARKFKDVASQSEDPTDVFVGDRMIGYGLHFLGQQSSALEHIDNALEHIPLGHRSHIIRFGYDQRVLADNILAEFLWLKGSPDQAMSIVERNVIYAQSLNHELSLCNALGQSACPIALFVGDLAAADRYVTALLEHSTARALPLWIATGRCFQAVLHIKSGNATGLNALRWGLDELLATRFATRYVAFLVEFADALCQAGEIASGCAAIEEALDLCRRNEELWCIAEVLRVKGELVLRQNKPDAAELAERTLRESLDWASRQGALSWELRAATSLARLCRQRRDVQAARQILEPVYGRFTEGFGSSDVIAAKSLLHELA
jgi:predicted ATPase/DNA-binding winged helix-turn-helix (wHTH) protein